MEEEGGGGKTIIGGDFNARTGRKGGRKLGEEEGEGEERKSRDEKENNEGRELVEVIGERGWMIVNGGMEGDEEGEWTYTGGRGELVIDYVIVNEEGWERITRLEVGDKIDSDHHSVIVVMKGDRKRVKRKKEMGRKGKRGIWTDESRGKYKENLGKIKAGEGTVEEEIEKINERIKEAMVREGEGEGRKRGGNGGMKNV
ncbi:hypothetical protein X777_07989 [Ooceraea biroi]|uniref:Uncharacterized protein n=1 Tax=Ooceraea biroi TaxID=2015173 RepID=A0A026W9Z7_OOCBI|nr:hypothetical protein X777_07989 [Ooceraea biroi]